MYTISWTNFKRLSPLDETPGLLSCLQWPGGPNSLHPNTPPTCWWCESLISERCWTRVLRFFSWLPVHIFFLLSMYLLIMFTLAVALYILYCFILCFSYTCTFHIIWSLTFLSFSFTFSHFIQIHLCWAAAFQWRLVPTPTWQRRKAARRHRWPENEHLPGFDLGTFLQIPFARGTFWWGPQQIKDGNIRDINVFDVVHRVPFEVSMFGYESKERIREDLRNCPGSPLLAVFLEHSMLESLGKNKKKQPKTGKTKIEVGVSPNPCFSNEACLKTMWNVLFDTEDNSWEVPTDYSNPSNYACSSKQKQQVRLSVLMKEITFGWHHFAVRGSCASSVEWLLCTIPSDTKPLCWFRCSLSPVKTMVLCLSAADGYHRRFRKRTIRLHPISKWPEKSWFNHS